MEGISKQDYIQYRKMWRAELEGFIDSKTGLLSEKISFYRECPLCGQNEYELLFTKDGFKFVKCRCDFIYVNPIIDESKTENTHLTPACDFIASKYGADDVKQEGPYSMEVLRTINRFKSSGRLLDIGCGHGAFLHFAGKMGWESHGIEINEVAAKYAIDNLNINVFIKSIEDQNYPDEYFDCIVCNQVLEHLVDPLDTLKEVYRILNSNGVLVVSVPNIKGWIVRILKKKHRHYTGIGHINYFTINTLTSMIKHAGFNEILKVRTWYEEFTIQEILSWIKNPNRYDFLSNPLDAEFAPDAHAESGHHIKRPFGRHAISILVDKYKHRQLFKKTLATIDFIPKSITNALKFGSYIDIYVRK